MIQINYRDTRPFYQQIKDNVRHLVVSGALKKDDKLPSVRELAASLAINPKAGTDRSGCKAEPHQW